MIVYPTYDAGDLCVAMIFGGLLGAGLVLLACWSSMRKGGAA